MSKVKAQEPEGFAEFWAIWRPHRRKNDGRGDARERYRKCLLNGADPERIQRGAEWYFTRMKPEPAYVPLAATWLNREAYEDCADDFDACDRQRAEREARETNVTRINPNHKTAFQRRMEQERRVTR